MPDFSVLLIFFAFVALFSYVLARGVWANKRVRKEDLGLIEGQVFRLVTPCGSYRSHFVGLDPKGFRISAPLYRDSHVPLRVGEKIVVQSPCMDSLVTFQTVVLAREPHSHELVLQTPTTYRRTDRRCEPRLQSVKGDPARLNGQPATLENLSAWGARVKTMERVVSGDLVNLHISERHGNILGYALEAKTSHWEGRMVSEVRIRFEEPLHGLTLLPHSAVMG